MATEIAKAYVQIIPTTKGIGNQLQQELGGAGDSAGKGFSSGFGSALKKGLALVGTAAIAKKAADFTKEIVGGYADYEQLTGGVETLFGESSDLVMSYAQNAFKTAGLSANDYMETVTGFSASLLQSLGGDTEAAAKVGDMAITDMADNANKMGSSIESIQNAYQGFAKQNYTMLDNLKLGYGGTKEEMQRLLMDAEAFSGVHYDISSLNDVYEAIHVVQGELGISGRTAEEAAAIIERTGRSESEVFERLGTTALEASETISGSAASMKAAWQNLLVGMADENANFEELVGNFVDSLAAFAENLGPRIEVAMNGIGELLTVFADTILPKMIEFLLDHLPELLETGVTLLLKIIEGILSAIPQLIEAIPEIITTIAKTMKDMWPELKDVGLDMIKGIWEGMKNAGDWLWGNVKDFFRGLINNVKNDMEINSPSKVWADQVGKFMAEGVGSGFTDEIDNVQKEISDSMGGLTADVAVSSASVNQSVVSGADDSILRVANAVVNGMQTAVGNGGNYNINLVTPDGSVMARWMFNPMVNLARANGTPIVNPV